MNVRSRLPQVMVLALLFCVPALGQTAASIKGRLIDPRGYDVGGLTVVARSDATGREYWATADASGAFSFDGVEAGRYTVASESEGMERSVAVVALAAG